MIPVSLMDRPRLLCFDFCLNYYLCSEDNSLISCFDLLLDTTKLWVSKKKRGETNIEFKYEAENKQNETKHE